MHTQGKWTVQSASWIGSYQIVEFSKKADRNATKKDLKSLFIEDNSNMKLISAAPDLLKACGEAYYHIWQELDYIKSESVPDQDKVDKLQSIYNKIKKAIEKAEGK